MATFGKSAGIPPGSEGGRAGRSFDRERLAAFTVPETTMVTLGGWDTIENVVREGAESLIGKTFKYGGLGGDFTGTITGVQWQCNQVVGEDEDGEEVYCRYTYAEQGSPDECGHLTAGRSPSWIVSR